MRLLPRTPMLLLALAPLALAGAVAGPAAGATAATAHACSGWNGAQPVSPARFSPLYSIAAVSPCYALAVGFQGSTASVDTAQPLIEQWTGSSWAVMPISTNPGFLDSVSVASANGIWAAGNTPAGALILHYDGTSWTQQPTPHDSDGSELSALDGLTASDAWAGGHNRPDGSRHALMMRWDGTSWNPSSLPPAVSGDNTDILSVSADSATDAWAVAQVGDSSALLHWDGTQWASSTVPGIWSVTALSPTSAWGVGYALIGNHYQTLTEHWDGSSWRVLSSPDPGGAGQDNVLTAVTATSGSDVWAVGRYAGGDGQPLVPFAMHWNGGSWTEIPLPVSGVQATDTNPLSVSAAAPGQAWISGVSGIDTSGQYNPFAVPVPVVPDVSGDTVSAATSALIATGLTVSSTQNTTTNCAPSISSKVASTDPAAGQQAALGQVVTLTVCSATSITPSVTVPNVTGQNDTSARNAITSAGLHVGTVTLTVSCTIPRGQVISQSPAGGTQAPLGSSVSLNEATRSGSVVRQITPHFCTQ
jgi:hypothetical protein